MTDLAVKPGWRTFTPALVTTVLILAATLVPAGGVRSPLPFWCVACGGLGILDLIQNIALFLPLGFLLRVAGLSALQSFVSAALLSVSVELAQFRLVPGRDASAGDIMANAIGAAAGIALAGARAHLLRPGRRLALVLAGVSFTLATSVVSATVPLLAPAAFGGNLTGQIAPQQNSSFEPWPGTVHSFVVNGIEVAYGPLVPVSPDSAGGSAFESGEITVLARVSLPTNYTTNRLSAIARLVRSGQEAVLVGQNGNDLVFRSRLESGRWMLRQPYVALSDALGTASGSGEANISARLDARGWSASVESASGITADTIPFSVALGWTFLLPFDRPLPALYMLVNGLWMMALSTPAAFFSSRFGPLAVLLATGLLGVAAATIAGRAAFDPLSAVEWAGIFAGAIAGWFLSRRMSPLPT
ncbi:MAG: VanZ family protein [Gemmatimonadota bacterium]